ncbi:MAG: YbjN domain-containing protein [Deltaproteobacteria bacterium]|nr:YbjN domain-containing protein [Deltaproteobacteria bacterium]
MTPKKEDVEKIEGFLKKLKIDPQKAQQGDNAWLIRQGNAHIFVLVAGGFLIFQSPMIATPKTNIQTLYRLLLELNDNASETLGTAFGINTHNEIVLKSLYPFQSLSFEAFSYFITSIAHVADKYRKQLKEKFDV